MSDRVIASTQYTLSDPLGGRMRGLYYGFVNFVILIGVMYLARRSLLGRAEKLPAQLQAREQVSSFVAAFGDDKVDWEWNVKTGQCNFSSRIRELIESSGSKGAKRWGEFLALVYDVDRTVLVEAIRRAIADQANIRMDVRVRTRLGEYRWFLICGAISTDTAGHARILSGVLTDIHDRKLMQIQLADEHNYRRALLDAIGDAVVTVDARGEVTFLSAAAESLTGFLLAESRGRSVHEVCRLVVESSGEALVNPIAVALADGVTTRCAVDLLLLTRDGLEIPVSQSVVPIFDQAKLITGAVLVIRDLSRERNFMTSLEVKDRHDASTRLVSRREFNRRIAFVLERARATGRYHAVVYVRVEPFDEILGKCGQAAADALLRQAGVSLRDNLRDGDTLAHLTGGAFGMLFENCPPEHAYRLAAKALDALKEFTFSWHYRRYRIGAYFGLVNIAEDLYGLSEVIAAAEWACAKARKTGRDCVYVYQPADGDLPQRQGDAEWVAKIHSAIEENRCRLFAQPVIPLDDSNADGPEYREVTVRLLDPRGRLVPAAEFISAAERFGMGSQLDQWVVRSVFLTLAKRRERALSPWQGRWSINLSATSVGDPKFATFLHQQFIHYGIPHTSICFEITEKVIEADIGQAQNFVSDLRKNGCRFALDKFGAGVSLFSQLKVLRLDYVKIDGAFIKGLSADPIDVSMVKAITSIASCMNIKVIAEFVETDAAISLLQELGVQFVQGNAVGTVQPFDAPAATVPTRLRVVPVDNE